MSKSPNSSRTLPRSSHRTKSVARRSAYALSPCPDRRHRPSLPSSKQKVTNQRVGLFLLLNVNRVGPDASSLCNSLQSLFSSSHLITSSGESMFSSAGVRKGDAIIPFNAVRSRLVAAVRNAVRNESHRARAGRASSEDIRTSWLNSLATPGGNVLLLSQPTVPARPQT